MFKLSSDFYDKFSRFQKKRFIILIDFQSIFLSYLLAFLLRLDFYLSPQEVRIMIYTFPIIFIIKAIAYFTFGVHQILWRYTSVQDLIKIVKVSTLSNILYVLVIYFFTHFEGYPRSIFLIDWFLLIMLFAGSRILYRKRIA